MIMIMIIIIITITTTIIIIIIITIMIIFNNYSYTGFSAAIYNGKQFYYNRQIIDNGLINNKNICAMGIVQRLLMHHP